MEPSISKCRYAVLQLAKPETDPKNDQYYVVYDRKACRLVDGTYAILQDALGVAQFFNADGPGDEDMAPDISHLLIYPRSK